MSIEKFGGFSLRFPEECVVTKVQPADSTPFVAADLPLPDPKSLGARVLILVPDPSRPFPVAEVLAEWTPVLRGKGLNKEDVRIMVGLGLHRKLNPKELSQHVGPEAYRAFTVLNHDPQECVCLGETSQGCPIHLNKSLLWPDTLLLLGSVEPHQYAGFSGGYKMIGIGCAGEPTISWLHSPHLIDSPEVTPGSWRNNPFRSALSEIASHVCAPWMLNLLIHPLSKDRIFFSGEPEKVMRDSCQTATRLFAIDAPDPGDLVMADVPGSKGINLYQATRALTSLALPVRSLLRPKGTFLLCAECPEGVGLGTGEQRFREALESPWEDLWQRPTLLPGEQRAYLVSKLLRLYDVWVCSPNAKPEWSRMGFRLISEPQELIDKVHPLRCLLVQDGCNMILHRTRPI